MEALWLFCGIVLIVSLLWAIDIFRNRRPLTVQESLELSRKRQRNQALSKFGFSTSPHAAHQAEKKAMKSAGELVHLDVAYYEAPARIAGLLKYKKHEWIVIAFIHSFHVRHLWWNKGPDKMQVWSLLDDHSLSQAIDAFKPDCIAILHNHPNPAPSYFRMNIPSEADLRSAGYYDEEFSQHGISLLEFICERGVPHLYYASFADSVVPIKPIAVEICGVNGASIFQNYLLRKELRRRTPSEQVAGGHVKEFAVVKH